MNIQNFSILLLVICLLVFADKMLTYVTLNNLHKNNPNIDYLKAEKNPVARWFFSKLGLGWGSFVFGILSIGLFYLALSGLAGTLVLLKSTNPLGIAYYIMFMAYALVIGNNTYFALKHSLIIP